MKSDALALLVQSWKVVGTVSLLPSTIRLATLDRIDTNALSGVITPAEGQRTQEPVPAVTPPVTDDAALTRAVQAERERTTQIDALCTRFGVDDTS